MVPKAIPKWMDNLSENEQKKRLKFHVQSLVAEVGASVDLWDAVNEMLWETTLLNRSNRVWPHYEEIPKLVDYIQEIIEWAREINPSARYGLNDYGLIQPFSYRVKEGPEHQQQRYLELVKQLKNRGCKIDFIGSQSHVGPHFHLGAFQKALDELAKSNIPLQITEFWSGHKKPVGNEELEKQLTFMKNAYIIGFGHPKVEHFTYWGNPFFNELGETTTFYDVLDELINKDWKTKQHLMVTKNNQIQFQGFYGDYMLRVNGKNLGMFSFIKSDKDPRIVLRPIN